MSETESIERVKRANGRAEKALAEATKLNDARAAAKAEADNALATAAATETETSDKKPAVEKAAAEAAKALEEAKAQVEHGAV